MGKPDPQARFLRWPAWLSPFRTAARISLRSTTTQPPAAPQKANPSDGGLTAWCKETANSLDLPELSRKVRVQWNSRMQTTAGRAWWPDRLIELNSKLKTLPPEETWRTLRHELAHLVAYERAGRKRIAAHGPEWRAACAELGIPEEQTYHSLPFKRRRMKRSHAYICPHCSATITRVRPLRKSVACYPCCKKHNNGLYHPRFRLAKIPAQKVSA